MRHILIILIGLLITVSCQKDFYLEDLQNTQELLANSRASHRDTSAALNALLDDANSEIAQLVDELTVVNAELMTSEEENADLLEQVSGLTLDLEDLQGVADGLTSDIARLTADLDAELAKNDANSAVIADLTDELNDLQAVYDELVANPVIEIQEVIRTVVRTVSVPGPTVTNTVTNTVVIYAGAAAQPGEMVELVGEMFEVVVAGDTPAIIAFVEGLDLEIFFNSDGTITVDIPSGDATLAGTYNSIEEFNAAADDLLNPVATQTVAIPALQGVTTLNDFAAFQSGGLTVGGSYLVSDDITGEGPVVITYRGTRTVGGQPRHMWQSDITIGGGPNYFFYVDGGVGSFQTFIGYFETLDGDRTEEDEFFTNSTRRFSVVFD